MDDTLLTRSEAAGLLGITVSALRWRARTGTPPDPIIIDGRWFYRADEIHQILEDRRAPPAKGLDPFLPSGYVTIAEAARLLGIGPTAVRARVSDGRLPSLRHGRHILIPTVALTLNKSS